MRSRHRRAQFPLAALVAIAAVSAVAPAAVGDDGTPSLATLALIGDGSVDFLYDPVSDVIDVRVSGNIPPSSSRVAGTWAAVIAGVRVTSAGATPVPTALTWTNPSYAVQRDFYFAKASDYGSLTVDLSYTGVGGYVLVRCVHTLEWNSSIGMNTAGADVGCA